MALFLPFFQTDYRGDFKGKLLHAMQCRIVPMKWRNREEPTLANSQFSFSQWSPTLKICQCWTIFVLYLHGEKWGGPLSKFAITLFAQLDTERNRVKRCTYLGVSAPFLSSFNYDPARPVNLESNCLRPRSTVHVVECCQVPLFFCFLIPCNNPSKREEKKDASVLVSTWPSAYDKRG